ncbi:transporter substrate-binding domain-containing protein [Vibrio sp. S4M6]|uniref:substrate-binding periplasmic protein n=1 Tax=Vibrio sinus TaxID=2946865 RepID=UPI00202AA665|nr:transporter substrate-binding domain-containing protein [Vibrio sinus]MCL9780783.1 transporter substrate-binding domain-containing protein [Vibrio sinus]
MKHLTSLLLILISLSSSPSFAENIVTISGSGWLPYYGRELKNFGPIAELIKEAYSRSGYQVHFSQSPWARVLEEVKSGNIDGTGVAFYTEERAKHYLFSEHFMTSDYVFFKRKDKHIKWSKLQDLKGLRIGVVRGSSVSPEFDDANYLNKKDVVSDSRVMQMLGADRLDLIPADLISGIYLIREKYPELRDQIDYISEPKIQSHKVYIMFHKGVDKDKISAFNEGLAKMKADGTYDKILSKHQ